MKSLSRKLCLLAGVSGLAFFGNSRAALAGGGEFAGPEERLQRLEQRINDLADRQEQLMRPLGAALDNGGPMGGQPGGPGQLQGPMGRRGGGAAQFQGPMGRGGAGAAQFQGPTPGPGAGNVVPMTPAGGPNELMEVRVHRLGDLARFLALVCMVCNVLLAIWIFTDIRKRGEGSGIFVALALVAGVPAAIVYALVRIGDKAAVTAK